MLEYRKLLAQLADLQAQKGIYDNLKAVGINHKEAVSFSVPLVSSNYCGGEVVEVLCEGLYFIASRDDRTTCGKRAGGDTSGNIVINFSRAGIRQYLGLRSELLELLRQRRQQEEGRSVSKQEGRTDFVRYYDREIGEIIKKEKAIASALDTLILEYIDEEQSRYNKAKGIGGITHLGF